MQPDLILIPFGKNATAGTIEPIPDTAGPGDGPQKATWNYGFPQVTMTPLSAGGIPPQGQDINGVLKAISEHTVFTGHGGQYKWSSAYVTASGGYSIGDVVQADDGLNSYVSLVNTNTANFNTTPAAIGVSWDLYAGRKTQTQATEAVAGIAKIATQAQVTTGTDDTKIVTPLKLAVRLASGAPVVGSARNVRMTVLAASASATLTADEVVVKSALGASAWLLSSFNKTINLATIGAGGMDTGSSPATGFVAVYAIYNPTTQVSALLATNAANLQSTVYGGSNMPAGYTASALLSVWITNASGQFSVGLQQDRSISFAPITVLVTTSTAGGTFVTTAIPKNAVTISGNMSITSTSSSMVSMAIYDSEAAVNGQPCSGYVSAGANGVSSVFIDIKIFTAQTIRWAATNLGVPTFSINVSSYKF